MIVAGIGCRKGATAREIEAALAAALEHSGRTLDAVSMIATAQAKATEPGIAAAAAALGVPLMAIAPEDLAAAGTRALTRSERVMAHMGVPSVAEAAALAAGGPLARLLAARHVIGPATCALAEGGDTP
jgi:cobalt-precorrin 5A hydrolase